MNPYSNSRLYELLKKELMAWVWNNPRLLHKITRFNLEYLFEFDPQRGLSVDLRRFDLTIIALFFIRLKKRNSISMSACQNAVS